MDKYVVPLKASPQNPKPHRRHLWKRSVVELNGRFGSKYRHEISGLLMQSYSEMNQIADGAFLDHQVPIKRQGISALAFDTKGIYLASVTKSGVLNSA
ncbi:hypothetical protein L1049_019163 [Liquidambar formosana]|uniref:Uncharacterized protein n=1 Tax=Liquidambar formosana TaxID=63359 RepID=A0AAP0RB60_LIQFO